MTDEKEEVEFLEPTDTELETAALMEEIGEKIDSFMTLRAIDEENETLSKEIDELINRFVTTTKVAGNGSMGKAVKKRWRKIKKSQNLKK